jgi:hypothetical protein
MNLRPLCRFPDLGYTSVGAEVGGPFREWAKVSSSEEWPSRWSGSVTRFNALRFSNTLPQLDLFFLVQ